MSSLLDAIHLSESENPSITAVRAHSVAPIAEEELIQYVISAFENPLDYPALSLATVPGDRVAIGVQQGIPQVRQILAGTLAALFHAGVEPEHISVVVPTQQERLKTELQEVAGGQVSVIMHAADDQEQLALLGVTEAGEPLRINRILCDADLVISLRAASGDRTFAGSARRILPSFSDQKTIERFRTPRNSETAQQVTSLAQESEHGDWMLGLGLALEVVPGPGGSIAQCYCGTPTVAAKHSAEGYQAIWSLPQTRQADLVVASIGPDPSQQNWDTLSRALSLSQEFAEPQAAIALCSEIVGPPGPSLRRLLDATDPSLVEKKLNRDHFEDSYFALQLCRALGQHTVYLASRMDPARVERLGLAPIANDKELIRLIRMHRKCLILDQAQYFQPVGR